MPLKIKPADTNVTVNHMLLDSTAGTVETGYTITDLDLTYVRQGQAPASKTDATALSSTSVAHADNKAIEIDGTNMPGLYRVDWPDAAFSDNAAVDFVDLYVKGSGLHPSVIRVRLDREMGVISDIYSDTLIIEEDTASDLPTAITAVGTQIDSELVVIAAEHAAIETMIDSELVVIAAEHAAIETMIDSEMVIVASDIATVYSDTTVIEEDTASDLQTMITAVGTQLDSEMVIVASDIAAVETMIDSEMVVVASDIAAVSTKIDSDAVLEAADHDKTQSDVAMVYSDTDNIYSDTTIIASDLIVLAAAADTDHDKTQSDIALISTKVDSDAVLADADHDKTQSDVALLSTKVDSDAVLEAADHDKTQSDIAMVYSDTDEISITASDVADAVWDEAISDHQGANSFGARISDIYSDTTEFTSGGGTATVANQTKIISDLVEIRSDTTGVESELTLVHSETTIIASDLILAYSDTTWIQQWLDGDWRWVTSGSPWEMQVKVADSDTVLTQKKAYTATGTAVTGVTQQVGRLLESAP